MGGAGPLLTGHDRVSAPSGAGDTRARGPKVAGALGAPMGGVPRPALLVVHAAGVAVEAAEVQLLLPRGPLLARGQVLGPPADRQLLRSQLLLLLRGQLPLELRPCSQSQRRQALRIPAKGTRTDQEECT